ncbi:MAG: hypothetical protein KIS29_05145 [Thermoplasmata archaeon]|nr:hypothetical protein [Candidatus Sysuiplasma jiujiangense]
MPHFFGERTQYNKERILRNVEQILEHRDIGLMNEETYRFISLHCGTIAHYDIDGWRHAYGDLRDFINLFLVRNEYGRNLQEEIRTPRWQEDDFRPYAPIVQGIIDLCREHREQVFDCWKATVVVTFFFDRKDLTFTMPIG